MNRRSRLLTYTGIYAIFYSFCLYKNLGGATFPFFVIGTLCYIWLSCKEFGLTWKRNSYFAAASAVILGISQMLTNNSFLKFFNIVGIFLLIIYLFLHQYSYDENWRFWQHFKNMFITFWGGFTNIYMPIKDLKDIKRSKSSDAENDKKSFPWGIVALTALITLPFLLGVIALLASADVVFSQLWEKLLQIKIWDIVLASVLAIIVFFFVYGIVARLLKFPFNPAASAKKNNPSAIAITVISMFDVIYVIFSVIQILYLFIGKMTLPEDYTYAEYAREGFFQLLAVCIFNVILVILAATIFEEKKALKILLTIMCACTYVMTASSAFRMILYIRYYYFSFDRILVLWTCVTIALILAGLLVQIWKSGFKFFRYCVVVVTGCFIVLSLSRPDYFIAKWNLAQANNAQTDFFLEDGYDDYDYLYWDLSLDAAPVLFKDAKFVSEYLNDYIDCKYDYDYEGDKKSFKNINFRNFNLSTYLAVKYAKNAGY